MNKEKLTELYKEYKLEKEDVFKHQHYLIITRSGIEKIQAVAKIQITYEVVRCEPNFAVFKAIAHKGSCLLYTSPSPRDGLLSRMPSSA